MESIGSIGSIVVPSAEAQARVTQLTRNTRAPRMTQSSCARGSPTDAMDTYVLGTLKESAMAVPIEGSKRERINSITLACTPRRNVGVENSSVPVLPSRYASTTERHMDTCPSSSLRLSTLFHATAPRDGAHIDVLGAQLPPAALSIPFIVLHALSMSRALSPT